MSDKIQLEVTEGPMQGQSFAFEEHDTFLFGRMVDCHACLPDDGMVSRHHFILEANPPDACIRDLGSLNGTYVNGTKYGSRQSGESPEEGAKRQYPQINLKHGDLIKVGKTILAVQVLAVCCQCGAEISKAGRAQAVWPGGQFICPACRDQFNRSGQTMPVAEPARCQECGKEVSAEIGTVRRGDYICQDCRQAAAADPAAMVQDLLAEDPRLQVNGTPPAISGYTIESRLGVGRFGAAYLAKRKRDGQHVALKIMLSQVAVDEKARQRFLREIDLLKDLRHPHIVAMLENGSAGGAFYFVMEHCGGGGVDALMKRRGGKLAVSEAGLLILQALEGLAYAHSKGVVHRNLKPSNILLASAKDKPIAKITDLSLAKSFDQAGLSGMTVTGTASGTPHFVPREQVTNFKRIRPASDIWSISATFYNMLTGQFPRDFPQGKDPMEVILNSTIVPVRKRDPSIPAPVAGIIDCALSDQESDRYATAAEMAEALRKAL